jgi:hypothetical protein
LGYASGLIRWLLVMAVLLPCRCHCHCCVLVGSGRSRPQLTPAIAHLVEEAQTHVQSACAVFQGGEIFRTVLSDVLIVRRTIAADWRRRLDGGAIRAQTMRACFVYR